MYKRQDEDYDSTASSAKAGAAAGAGASHHGGGRARASGGFNQSSGSGSSKPKQCAECGKIYQTREGLRLHIRNIHIVDKKHQCTECDRAFVRAGDLRLHILRMHGTAQDRPFPCSHDNCHKTFACKSELVRHEKTHSKKRPSRGGASESSGATSSGEEHDWE